MTRDTSIAAYNTIKDSDLLSKRRFEVYDVLYSHGPLTASQIEVLIPGEKSPSRGSNVHARLCELREMGVVSEKGEIVCPISGMTVIAFDVTSALPTKLAKKITSSQKIDILQTAFKEALIALRKNGLSQEAEDLKIKIMKTFKGAA